MNQFELIEKDFFLFLALIDWSGAKVKILFCGRRKIFFSAPSSKSPTLRLSSRDHFSSCSLFLCSRYLSHFNHINCISVVTPFNLLHHHKPNDIMIGRRKCLSYAIVLDWSETHWNFSGKKRWLTLRFFFLRRYKKFQKAWKSELALLTWFMSSLHDKNKQITRKKLLRKRSSLI